jgi:hypothetical protein
MARAKAKPVARRTQEARIRHLFVLDALRGLSASGIAAAAIFILWVLFNAELLSAGPALTLTGLLGLFIAMHMGLRDFLSEHTPRLVSIVVVVFACAWLAGLGWPLSASINPPPPLFSDELRAGGPSATVPVNGNAGQYRIVVSGHLPQTNEQTGHNGHYRLRVNDGADVDRIVEGDFTENWRRQRIGRRGGLPVRVVHSVVQHRLTLGGGHDMSLALTELSGNVGSSVHVEVYRQAVSTSVLTAIGIVLAAGALVLDGWRVDAVREGLMTIETLAAFGGVAAFRSFGAANPGFGDLLVNMLIGVVPGAAAGALLWRTAGASLRRFVVRPD